MIRINVAFSFIVEPVYSTQNVEIVGAGIHIVSGNLARGIFLQNYTSNMINFIPTQTDCWIEVKK